MVIFCVVAALLVMQTYIKRSLQGRLKQAGDSFGQQYSPGNTVSTNTFKVESTTVTTVNTKSEKEFYEDCLDEGFSASKCKDRCDIDDDGIIEESVFATETLSTLGDEIAPGETTTQIGDETVGPLEDEEPVF